MLDSILVEIFTRDFAFLSKEMVKPQKYGFDYMSPENNTLTVPKCFEVHKNNYIRLLQGTEEFQGIVTAVEHKSKETKIQYKPLLSVFDVDVYKDRNELKNVSVERFIGTLILENFATNEDSEQNMPGMTVEEVSETMNGALNLKDNIHNIYDIFLSAFRKYEILVNAKLDFMKRTFTVTIGKREYTPKTIEGDLKNILDVNVTMKETDESVNKAIIIGTYDEESDLAGKTEKRTFYLDGETGKITEAPSQRVLPVVFRYKTLEIHEESFEEDAYQEAYDLIYQEKYDNEIKVKLNKNDPLYNLDNFEIGQACRIIKGGVVYRTVFTGYVMDSTVTLIFGMIRIEYTKKLRRK